jgi:hypothetical protein
MKRPRLTIALVAVLALCAAGLFSGAADAGSLLSGYGGPGEGNQAVLGSALINGPSGKGGAGGAGGAGAGGYPVAGSLALASQSTSATGHGGAGRSRPGAAATDAKRGSGVRANGKHAPTTAAQSSNRGSQAYIGAYGQTASRRAHGGSQTLGLSGADLLYILLALGLLVLTGVLTRRLARANRGDGEAAQAMRRRTRLSN